MSSIIKKEGFNYAFNADACSSCGGRCCIGESGNIFVSTKEMQNIAKLLEIDIVEFHKKYLVKRGYRFSLKENRVGDSYDCVFFQRESGFCKIYNARPQQCKTFPFWDYFKDNIQELKLECPGIIDD